MVSACLLVSHGSRDPRSLEAMEKLACLMRQREFLSGERAVFKEKAVGVMERTQPLLVGTATLELASIPLHESIRRFAQTCETAGLEELEIVPLFLLPGVHVREDIPVEVERAQKAVGNKVKLHLQPYLGSHAGIVALLEQQFQEMEKGGQQKGNPFEPREGRIILSHGSRRVGANETIEAIASSLNSVAAYWSVSPSLSEQVERLAKAEKRKIRIVPYFLFSGKIADAIALQVKALQIHFPHLELQLGEPLGPTPQLADLILSGIAV